MKSKKTIILITSIVAAFFVICGAFFFLHKKAVNNLVHSMNAYETGTRTPSDIQADFAEDSPEFQLFQGIEKIEDNEYDAAHSILKKAQEIKGLHCAAAVYLAFYENECAYLQNGVGNYDAIVKFFKHLSKCKPLYNDTDFIWRISSTFIDTEENREKIITLLNDFLHNTAGISQKARLTIIGNTGMLNLMNDNYSEGVFAFRTVIDESQYVKDPDEGNYLKIRALEYLGNLYEVLDELESAIKIYDTAISLSITDKELEATAKYASYMNRNTCYIDLGDYRRARQSAEEAKAIMEYLPADMKAGVELFQYNNDAYLALSENDLETAENYQEICYDLLNQIDKESFLNNELFVALTDLQLTVKKGEYTSAIEKANALLSVCQQYDASFRVSIYLSVLEIYDKTNQKDLYVETA